MEAEFIKNHGQNCIAFSWEEAGRNAYELEMLRYNKLLQLLPVKIRRIDSRIFCAYEISGRQPMTVLFDRKPIRLSDIKEIFSEMDKARTELTEYLLEADGLVLEPDFLYGKAGVTDWRFCYSDGGKEEFAAQLQTLLQFVLDHLDYQDTECVGVAYGLYQECQKSDGDFKSLLQYLQGVKKEEQKMEKNEDVSKDRASVEEPEQTGLLQSEPYFAYQTEGKRGREYKERGLVSWLVERVWNGGKRKQQSLRLALSGQQESEEMQEYYKEEMLCGELSTSQERETMTAAIPEKEHFETQDLEEQAVRKQYWLKAVPETEGDIVGMGRLELSVFPYVVGKVSDSVDGFIDSPFVSRFHARLTLEEDELYIEDLNSKNGTFVNQTEIFGKTRQKLQVGDEISFADVSYRLEMRLVR